MIPETCFERQRMPRRSRMEMKEYHECRAVSYFVGWASSGMMALSQWERSYDMAFFSPDNAPTKSSCLSVERRPAVDWLCFRLWEWLDISSGGDRDPCWSENLSDKKGEHLLITGRSYLWLASCDDSRSKHRRSYKTYLLTVSGNVLPLHYW